MTLLVVLSWLLNTPAGLLGKADAVGYAVCHRIDGRSFHLGDRSLPLCARCTGIYLGAWLGMLLLAAGGRLRASGLPVRGVLLVLLGFIAIMGADGANSYLSLIPGAPHLYEPRNWLRLVTGTLNGLALAGLVVPVLNQTLWKQADPRRSLASFRELALWLAPAALVVGLVLSEDARVLYPLALISAVGVIAMFTAVNTTLALLITRRENRVEGWCGAALPLLVGFTLTMLQVAAIDAVRFALFGTWEGLMVPG